MLRQRRDRRTSEVRAAEGVYRETPSHGERLMVVRFRFRQGARVPPHRHPHEQSSYLVSGYLRYNIAGREVVLRPGDSLVVPGNAEHSAVALEDETVDVDSFTPLQKTSAKAHAFYGWDEAPPLCFPALKL